MENAIKNVKFCSRTITGTTLAISINGQEVLKRDVLSYPDAVRTYALMDRFASKLVDSVANLSKANDATKARATILDLDAQLAEGNWNKPTVVGPKEVFPLQDLVEGLFGALKKTPEGKAVTVEQCQGMLEGLGVAGRNEVAKNPAVRAEVLTVQTRRAQAEAKKEPSLGDLLSRLGKV